MNDAKLQRARASQPSAFKTPEGEARYLAAYDAALKLWPVPYDEIDIPTRFGTTHVVVSGANDAPPLVLLHGYMATSVMWSPNMIDFSQDYRSTPSTPWGNQARASRVTRYEMSPITSRG